VNRTLVLKSQTEWLESLQRNKQKNGSHIINELIKNNNLEWKTYMQRLNDYKSFLVDSGYQHLIDEDSERLIYSIIRDINGVKVGIAGLNSAWSSSGSDEDKAKIWLGTYQIIKTYNSIKDTKLSIVLSHHPPNWFTTFEDPLVSREIENKFNFHLHGHEHQVWVSDINKHIRIPAGAFYGGSEQDHVS
jgi:calcineurin-like phosphoesterase family protein